MEHDFQVRLMFVASGVITLLETLKADGWRRWIFGTLTAALVLGFIFWPQLKSVYSPATDFIASIASNGETWFSLLAIALIAIAISGRKQPNNFSTVTARSVDTMSEERIANAVAEKLQALDIGGVKPQSHGMFAEALMPRPPFPANDPPDVMEAKLRLGNFVVRSFMPAIHEAQTLIHLAAQYVAEIDPTYPGRRFAYGGVMATQPRASEMFPFFDSVESIRGARMVDLENQITSAASAYAAAARTIADIIEATHDTPGKWLSGMFWAKCEDFVVNYKNLEDDLHEISRDIHYKNLRGRAPTTTFIPMGAGEWLEFLVRVRKQDRDLKYGLDQSTS